MRRLAPALILFRHAYHATWRALVIGGLLLAMAETWYRLDGYLNDLRPMTGVEAMAIRTQLQRASGLSKVDTVLVGDSSCLMGISAPLMTRLMGGRRVESLCTIAYAGPRAYAAMLRFYLGTGQRPQRLVIMLHPIQTERDRTWDYWVNFTERGGVVDLPRMRWGLGGLSKIRDDVIAPFLYIPLQGQYGWYYGSEHNYMAEISENQGSAIDPGAGVNRRAMPEFDVAPISSVPPDRQRAYPVTPAFEESLGFLAGVIEEFDKTKVHIIISPLPDAIWGEKSEAHHNKMVEIIKRQLRVTDANIMELPRSFPSVLFSSETHLNRWGREHFTEVVSERIKYLQLQ